LIGAVIVAMIGAVHEPDAFITQLAGKPRLVHAKVALAVAVIAVVAVTNVPGGGGVAVQ
jgi:hypothetical protein